MTLGRRSVLIVLAALYVVAVWARFAGVDGPEYPYYKGESGTNFRIFHEIADRGSIASVDVQASWPEGYSPSLVRPTGVEYFTGFAYRLVRPFSDVSEKKFLSVFGVLFFSLSVFTLFVLTRRLWACQAAGIFAACLVALSAPLVGATSGGEFIHASYAFVVISLHLAIFLGAVARPSMRLSVLCGAIAFALLSSWEGAGLYVAAFGLVVLALPMLSPETRRQLLAAHLVAAIAAAAALPHLRGARFILAWPMIWLAVITAFSFVGHRLPRKVPGWVYIAAGFAALTLIMQPFRSGGTGTFDPASYWYHRVRFLAGKPIDPSVLPDAIRLAWNRDHSPPGVAALVTFFAPLVLLLPFAVAGIRKANREGKGALWLPTVLSVVGSAAYFVDRRAVFSAALLAFPLVSGAFRGLSANARRRALPAALAVAFVAATSPIVAVNVATVRRMNSRFVSLFAPADGFTWASIGNAD
ncbi:MAG: hypothetical protein H6Q78_1370, partial [Candidatus Krumholzibacteriota bacterium]|nr:hypothetical protein [Candidatus Krumholzibacteriota bacterium]